MKKNFSSPFEMNYMKYEEEHLEHGSRSYRKRAASSRSWLADVAYTATLGVTA